MNEKPQVLSFVGSGHVKLNKAAIKELLQSEGFKRQLKAVRQLAKEYNQSTD